MTSRKREIKRCVLLEASECQATHPPLARPRRSDTGVMHGRPRQAKGVPVDPEKAKAKEKKFQQFRQLTNAVLKSVEAGQTSEEALAQSALLLQKNPDVYTVWNYRRNVLSPELEGEQGVEKAKERAAKELKVTEAALLENPKSYSAWYNRLWVMRKGLLPFSEELALVTKFALAKPVHAMECRPRFYGLRSSTLDGVFFRFLQMDCRNFLAWKYRREIVKLAGTPLEDELDYTRSLIDANFSNYSAWHNRSCLLTQLHESRRVVDLRQLLSRRPAELSGVEPAEPPAVPLEALEEEYELAQQAFFTDPEDQSAYMYHQWLLQMSTGHFRAAQGSRQEEAAREVFWGTLAREAGRCRELLELEPDRRRCKWPMLSLAGILALQQAAGVASDQDVERAALLAELADIDPLRKGFYADQALLFAPAC